MAKLYGTGIRRVDLKSLKSNNDYYLRVFGETHDGIMARFNKMGYVGCKEGIDIMVGRDIEELDRRRGVRRRNLLRRTS